MKVVSLNDLFFFFLLPYTMLPIILHAYVLSIFKSSCFLCFICLVLIASSLAPVGPWPNLGFGFTAEPVARHFSFATNSTLKAL